MSRAQKPTELSTFKSVTLVDPEGLAESVLKVNDWWKLLSEKDREWFCSHVSVRLRHMHANMPAFCKRLNSPFLQGKEAAQRWVEGWAEMFMADKADYKTNHPLRLRGMSKVPLGEK